MGRKWWIVVGLVVAAICWESTEVTKAAPTESLPAFQAQTTEPSVKKELEFPIVVKGSGLIAEHTAQYEGPFLENETQEPVSGVMALMVYNPGAGFVDNALLCLQQGERILLFEITMLPPGSRVLVLEKNGQLYSEEAFSQCVCLSLEFIPDMVAQDIIVSEENGTLVVENRSDRNVNGVTLCYKQFDHKEGFYLGGYTNRASIGNLLPGETRTVVPYRYVCGYSKVVAVLEKE
ncbi:MAG: hypothetical protein IJF02_01280 [Oscillospiraceae bacterium]|nr:hypothetical protein [Oscillospiraceae bacterium]